MQGLRKIKCSLKHEVKRQVKRKEEPACRSMEEAPQSTLTS
jgi:hypothetical protein